MDSEQDLADGQIGEPLNVAAPTQNIEAVNKTVSTLFNYKRAGTYKDIAAAAGIHPANVSQALSASRDLGLSQLAGKRGLYSLTKDGQDYARLLTAGKIDEAKVFLRKVILSNPSWGETVAFLRSTSGQKRDPIDIVLDAERKRNKQWSQSMRSNVKDSLISILTYAGLVVKEGDAMVSVLREEEEKIATDPTGGRTNITRQNSGTSPPRQASEFARLQSDDFLFEVRKDPTIMDFAREQFNSWLDHVKRTSQPVQTSTDTTVTGQNNGGTSS